MISQRMAEKCSQVTWILERKDREFEEAMREQVGTIIPSANGLNNVESSKCLLTLVLSSIVKQNETSGYAYL